MSLLGEKESRKEFYIFNFLYVYKYMYFNEILKRGYYHKLN